MVSPSLVYPVPIHTDGRLPVISNPWGTGAKTAYARFGGHPGVDLMYPARPSDPPYRHGSPVRSRMFYMPDDVPALAVSSGVVSVAALDPKTGWAVRILHDQRSGFSTVYCHLADIQVAKGDVVVAGEQIGHIGRSPVPGSLNHLHYEVWINGRIKSRCDPYPFLLHYTPIRMG